MKETILDISEELSQYFAPTDPKIRSIIGEYVNQEFIKTIAPPDGDLNHLTDEVFFELLGI